MSGTTKMPPCGARRVQSKAIDSAPVTAPPAITDGITRRGSAAANGIAPSLMKDAPRTQAARPFSRSVLLNSLLRTVVASAMASGGTMPAAITAAITLRLPGVGSARPPTAKAYATLLSGPPMSKHIIRPSTMPRMIALEPESPLRPSVRARWRDAIGLPTTMNMRKPTTAEAIRGITSTGMMPRSVGWTFTRWIAITTAPASRPATRPPRKPALMVSAMAPPTKPGTSAGRSAMPYAMYPASTGTRKANAAVPI